MLGWVFVSAGLLLILLAGGFFLRDKHYSQQNKAISWSGNISQTNETKLSTVNQQPSQRWITWISFLLSIIGVVLTCYGIWWNH